MKLGISGAVAILLLLGGAIVLAGLNQMTPPTSWRP